MFRPSKVINVIVLLLFCFEASSHQVCYRTTMSLGSHTHYSTFKKKKTRYSIPSKNTITQFSTRNSSKANIDKCLSIPPLLLTCYFRGFLYQKKLQIHFFTLSTPTLLLHNLSPKVQKIADQVYPFISSHTNIGGLAND